MATGKIQLKGNPKHRRRRVGTWFTLIFGVAFIVAIVISWIASSQNQAGSHGSHNVPSNLGQMELLGQVTGEQAIAEIAKLHGKGIEVADGYMAEYGHGRDRAMVWVGKAASEIAASDLLKLMVDRIKDGTGNQPFRNLRSINIGGKEVFMVDGPGGDNFFYASDNKVVWLALQVQGGDSLGVVKTAIKTF